MFICLQKLEDRDLNIFIIHTCCMPEETQWTLHNVYMYTPQLPTTARSRPRPELGVKNSTQSPTWVAGTQLLEPSLPCPRICSVQKLDSAAGGRHFDVDVGILTTKPNTFPHDKFSKKGEKQGHGISVFHFGLASVHAATYFILLPCTHANPPDPFFKATARYTSGRKRLTSCQILKLSN